VGHARTKLHKLQAARQVYLLAPGGVTDAEIARLIGVDRASAYRYRKELGGVEVSPGRYTLVPTTQDIQLALAVLQRSQP
jgi:DNA-binding IclR family transcriptional regulator